MATAKDKYRQLLEMAQANNKQSDTMDTLSKYVGRSGSSPVPAPYPKPERTNFYNDYRFNSGKAQMEGAEHAIDAYGSEEGIPYKDNAIDEMITYQNAVQDKITPRKGVPRKGRK